MPAENLAAAILNAGLTGMRRMAETQARLARGALAAFEERGAPQAWDKPQAGANDVLRDYLTDMALDCSVAAGRLARGLQPTAGFVGPPKRTYEIDGTAVLLPARVEEASQGSASYAVDPAVALQVLDEADLPFRPVVVGGGAAMLGLFMVDYRVSDLGAYAEIGAAIMGRPGNDPFAPPGMVIFALPVSGAFTRDCGRGIWGYPKVRMEAMSVRREPEQGVANMGPPGAGGFRMAVPRRGSGRSEEVPLLTYTLKDGRPTRTLFRRSGAHERLKAGGRVGLALGGATEGVCECGMTSAEPPAPCLCATLRRLGLPERRPVASGWTEAMSGSFGVPEALAEDASAAPVEAPMPTPRPKDG